MSSAVQSPSLPSPSPAAAHYATQANSSFHVFQAATPNTSVSRTASVSEAPTPAAPVESAASDNVEVKVEPVPSVDVQAFRDEAWRRGKQKGRRPEEVDIMAQTAARIAERLAADHAAVLHPDVDTPFADAEDVVKRLLPYHIYQHPMDDLVPFVHPNGKGKRKATEEELLRQEIAETRFALQCRKRKTALEKRFRAIRTRAGKRTAPDDQSYVLAHAVLEADRAENAALNSEYRTARAELDSIDRKRKLAMASQTIRVADQASASTSTSSPSARAFHHTVPNVNANAPAYTTAASTPNYGVTAPTATQPYSAAAASSYTQYRGYTYPYPQASPYTYSPYATTPTATAGYAVSSSAYTQPLPPQPAPVYQEVQETASSALPGTPNPGGTPVAQPLSVSEQARMYASATVPPPALATTTVTNTQATPTPVASTPTAPIPVMLPVAALTTLSGMGIIPVPLANAPPAGQPQPAAVIKGTTQNGTMVNLEINVSALQASQAGALAVLLSALTARGANVGGATPIPVAPAGASPEAGADARVEGSASEKGGGAAGTYSGVQ